MPANPDYDAILSTTLAKYRNTLQDNVFSDRPLFDFLKRNDKIRMIDGGESIVEQLMHAMNSTAKSYTGYDTLDITPQEGISAAVYPWRQFAASVAISGIEEAKNSGESKIVDLLKAKVMQAEETMAEVFDQMGFGDGTTVGRNWYGLGNLVGTGALGGIDPAVAGNEFWRSVVVDANADLDPVRNTNEWTNAYYSASKGNNNPDFGITTQALFEHYEASLAPQLRFTSNDEADARFQNLLFKGIRLYFDTYCPTGVTYFLNSRYLSLVGHKGTWFRNTPFKDAPDKDARWAQILCYGNMTTSNRSRQAKVVGQTVA